MKDARVFEVETRLRSEAKTIRERNGFSRLLHERCMTALRREGLKGLEAKPTRPWGGWRVAAAAGIAAAVAVGTWLMVRTPETPVEPGPPIATARGTEIPGDLVPVIQPRVPDSTTGMLVERKYAYLDRDARRLLIFVADQFPEFPGPQAPENGEREPK